jgi:hypothetical protein
MATGRPTPIRPGHGAFDDLLAMMAQHKSELHAAKVEYPDVGAHCSNQRARLGVKAESGRRKATRKPMILPSWTMGHVSL